MNYSFFRIGSILVCGSLGVACISGRYVKSLPVESKTPTVPINLSGQAPRMTTLSSMMIDIPAGIQLGQSTTGWRGSSCRDPQPITYRRGTTQTETRMYEPVFREVMEQSGVPVQQTLRRFEGEEITKADFQIAGAIKEMVLNICYPGTDEDIIHAIGEGYVKMEWSVFSPLEKRIVYTATTSGQTDEKIDTRLGEAGIIREAFRKALQKLMAQIEFSEVLLGKQAVDRKSAKNSGLLLPQPPRLTSSIKDNLEALRAGVVTIQGNAGSGSGFAVGQGEFILTCAHVVSGSKFVKILGARGEERYGEVVRKSVPRDLALIKLEKAYFKPLHLSKAMPREGVEAYAIGSPLGNDFAFTVTKGIVGGVRRFEERDYIQSDVTTLPGSSGGPLLDVYGNVLGISSSGVTILGAPAGMNFFIPARDVFTSLSLQDAVAK